MPQNILIILRRITVARLTAIGFPSRLYTISMYILALTLALQSELHALLYKHGPARRCNLPCLLPVPHHSTNRFVGWVTSFTLFFRLFWPEDVYNEANLPLLVEVRAVVARVAAIGACVARWR